MIKTPTARRLCTKVELNLYLESLPRAVKDVTPARLKQRVQRARTLRDKYRGQAKDQARAARGKGPARGKSTTGVALRTQQKAELFAEVLERYQTAARAKPKAAKKAVKKKATKKKAVAKRPAKKKAATKKTTRKKTTARKAAPKKAAPRKVAKKKAATKTATKKKATRKKTSRGKIGATSMKRDAAAKASRFKRGSNPRTARHTASRTRRTQARSDAKGR